MIKYKQGDLIEAFKKGEVQTILHQCNCTVGMGAGIAKSLCNSYKDLDTYDKKTRTYFIEELNRPDLLLGWHTLFQVHNSKEDVDLRTIPRIINIYSQYYPGKPNKELLKFDTFKQRLAWLKSAIDDIYNYMLVGNCSTNIGLPLLASGLAASPEHKARVREVGITDKDTSLYYFKEYIEPIIGVLATLKDSKVTVYYL